MTYGGLPPYPHSEEQPTAEPVAVGSRKTSRWVYVFSIAGGVLVTLFVILHLIGVAGPGGH